MGEHDIAKGLEVWTLQTLLDISIACGLLAAGLALIQDYWRSLEKRLSLRVSIELWQVFTVVMVDILLGITVLIGYLVLNPDIMSDVKMAVPLQPLATILFAVALVLRLCYGGHDARSPNYVRGLWLMFAANVVNVIGFTFVVEAASEEYLAHHPNVVWEYIRAHFRSNADPHGLELAEITFWVCFPILAAIAVWGIGSALRRLTVAKGQ